MHYTVMLKPALNLLKINHDGIYVDGTFGRGGHSRAILQQLGTNGRLIAFDKDPDAIKFAVDNIDDKRFIMINDSFANLKLHLQELAITKIDGLLLDLGVSSPQLDNPERGFSFRFNAPLDMRMDNSKGLNAKDWLASASQSELADVFWRYGEEKFARKIAQAIVAKRQSKPLVSTEDLANLVSHEINYHERGQHPATRVFQAIRIYVNNELGDLEQILNDAPELLKLGGRIVVISFHSLEDRLVKASFNNLAKADNLPKWVMATKTNTEFHIIAKKIRADDQEVSKNKRSRSAVMRCLERVGGKGI